jgi:hypothetical protein
LHIWGSKMRWASVSDESKDRTKELPAGCDFPIARHVGGGSCARLGWFLNLIHTQHTAAQEHRRNIQQHRAAQGSTHASIQQGTGQHTSSTQHTAHSTQHTAHSTQQRTGQHTSSIGAQPAAHSTASSTQQQRASAQRGSSRQPPRSPASRSPSSLRRMYSPVSKSQLVYRHRVVNSKT